MTRHTSGGRLPIGLAAYSFPFGCGFLQRNGRRACDTPMDAWRLIELASGYGLARIEIPLAGVLPDLAPATIDRLRGALAEVGLGLVVDSGVVDVEELRALLPLAARAGAAVVRATLSPILEGARAGWPGGWEAHLAEMRRRIVALRPDLERHGVTLALENHQDATSDDLLLLCEAGGGCVGVTLDVANPLAVCEDPLAFARKVGPWIRNVHLKDYTIHATESGYRLVRAAIGAGDLPWPELLATLAAAAPGAPQQIELAALHGRHIRVWQAEWWDGFPACDLRAALPGLRFLALHARPPGAPWQTPWELEAPPEEVGRWELAQLAESVRFLDEMRIRGYLP
jgi:sugar phosphate isomerase/epimerase